MQSPIFNYRNRQHSASVIKFRFELDIMIPSDYELASKPNVVQNPYTILVVSISKICANSLFSLL